MRLRFLVVTMVCVLCLTGASTASAQGTTDGFAVGYTDVGPVIGVGGLGGGGISFGGRLEHAFKELPNLGNGILGFQVSADYYHYDSPFFGSDFGFTVFPVSVTANYHFRLMNRKIDPFVGAGLGYQRVSSDFNCDDFFGVTCDVSSSGIYFVGRAGVRYFVRPKLAVYADVGAGAAALNVGVMLRIK